MSARENVASGLHKSESSENIYNLSYIECFAELFILRSMQKTSNDALTKLKAAKIARLLANSRYQYGPAVQDILSEKIRFHEGLLPVLHEQERTRIDYLNGATNVEPVHDVLFPGLTKNPIPANEADWNRASSQYATIQTEVNALKPKTPAIILESPGIDADPQHPSAKRRRLDSSSYTSVPLTSSSASGSKKPKSGLTVKSLKEMIQDTHADISHINDDQVCEVEQDLHDAFDQHERDLRNHRSPVPLFNEANMEDTFLYRVEQLRLQSREDVALVENEVMRRRDRNAELERLNQDMESRIAKYEQWVREASTLVEILKSTPSPLNSESEPSLLSHPHIAPFVAPLRHDLKLSAQILMYGLLEGVRKDLQDVIGGRADDLLKDFERELKPTFQQTEEIFHALF